MLDEEGQPIIVNRKLPHPTHHMPGTEGKKQVLHERVMRGEQLWNPLDAGMSNTLALD